MSTAHVSARTPRALSPLRRGVASLLVSVVFTGLAVSRPAEVGAGCAGDAICQQIQSQQGRASGNAQALNDIENKIADVQAKMHALAALIASLNANIAADQQAIDETQGRIASLDAKIRETEADLARRQAQLDAREQLFGQRVRSMDKHGSVNYLDLVLTASSFNELLDRVVIMQQLVESDHQLIEELRSERAAVARARDELNSERAQQAQLLAHQQWQQQQLQDQKSQLQSAFAYQAKLEAQYSAQRQVLEAQQAQIAGAIRTLQAEYAAELAAIAARQRALQLQQQQQHKSGGSPGTSSGPPSGFIWPQASHLITQGFGCTDLLGEPYWPSCATKHFHTGIDIAGPDGTPIYASATGIVTDYPGTVGYGNLVIILHPGSYATVYAHLSSFALASGSVVNQGQVIGYEGSTGYSTGPHLHFEVRYNDVWQNPCAYVGC